MHTYTIYITVNINYVRKYLCTHWITEIQTCQCFLHETYNLLICFRNEKKCGAFNGVISTFSLDTEGLVQKYRDVELQLIFLKTEVKFENNTILFIKLLSSCLSLENIHQTIIYSLHCCVSDTESNTEMKQCRDVHTVSNVHTWGRPTNLYAFWPLGTLVRIAALLVCILLHFAIRPFQFLCKFRPMKPILLLSHNNLRVSGVKSFWKIRALHFNTIAYLPILPNAPRIQFSSLPQASQAGWITDPSSAVCCHCHCKQH